MAGVDVAAFLGITPMVAPEDLPNEQATLAENCRLEGGDLESWKAPLQIKTLTSATPILSIYRFGIGLNSETDYWFQWTVDVDVVRGPLADDIEERTYWTGDGYPKKTKGDIAAVSPPYPSNSYKLGIPAPALAPNVTISGSATNPDDDPSTTSLWGYTYVTTWDEEGPMSPYSSLATYQPGQTPQLSGMSPAPTGPYTIDRKRIYRANTGSNATDFQLVAEIPVATASFNDTVPASGLGKIAETRLWVGPPDDLAGLCLMSNEIMAGFTGSTVRLSVPGVAYAWPEKFAYNFPAPIVGIKPFGEALLVCTKRSTHLLGGVDPAAMSQVPLNDAGVCLSKRGMVAMGGGVLYPTKVGLQFVNTSGVSSITDAKFDEKTWAQFAPSSFNASQVNNRYVAMYDTGTVQGSIVFSFNAPGAITTSTVWGTAIWQEAGTDTLYVVQSNAIKRWDGGAALTAKWGSKLYRYPRELNMAVARVEADAYPVTFRLYSNGSLVHTQTVTSEREFALPGGYETKRYSFQYEGATRVTRIQMATSSIELANMG